jgi:UDP-glucose 4-epimerase
MIRSLVTGGAGFIGSHLADALLRRGEHVWMIDDLSTGSVENIEALKGQPGFTYVIDTIQNRGAMAELVDRVDVVYHLAAAVGVRLIIESPVRTIETNIKGTELVLELAAKKGKKVLLTSTSEIYGKADSFPFAEDSDIVLGATVKSRWSYACSKAIDEFLALAYGKERRLPVVIARLFNTVGPRQTGRYGMVIPSFVKQALAGEPLTVFGDGKQSRCFAGVADVVGALIELAHHPGAVGQVFNVGCDEEISIADLAYRIKEMTGSPSPVVFVPYDQAYEEGFEDMRRRVPDLSKIRRLIGYAPKMTLEQTLAEVVEYYRARPRERGEGTRGSGHGEADSLPVARAGAPGRRVRAGPARRSGGERGGVCRQRLGRGRRAPHPGGGRLRDARGCRGPAPADPRGLGAGAGVRADSRLPGGRASLPPPRTRALGGGPEAGDCPGQLGVCVRALGRTVAAVQGLRASPASGARRRAFGPARRRHGASSRDRGRGGGHGAGKPAHARPAAGGRGGPGGAVDGPGWTDTGDRPAGPRGPGSDARPRGLASRGSRRGRLGVGIGSGAA